MITDPRVPYPRKVKRIQKHMVGDIPKEKLCNLCAVSGMTESHAHLSQHWEDEKELISMCVQCRVT